jgi:hypothetical protein
VGYDSTFSKSAVLSSQTECSFTAKGTNLGTRVKKFLNKKYLLRRGVEAKLNY